MRIQYYFRYVFLLAGLFPGPALATETSALSQYYQYAAIGNGLDYVRDAGEKKANIHSLVDIIKPDRIQEERGCCLYKTPKKAKCAMSYEEICKKTADKNKLDYIFFKGKNCKQIPECN